MLRLMLSIRALTLRLATYARVKENEYTAPVESQCGINLAKRRKKSVYLA
jgi:hypothetical protein